LDGSELRRLAGEIDREFPLAIRRTCLVLLEVDPFLMQAQWHIAPRDLTRLRGAFPEGAKDVRTQLRLLRYGGPPDQGRAEVLSSPTLADALEGTTPFRVDGDGAEYQAELGLSSSDGGWLLLARSNRVRLPRPISAPILPRAAHADTSDGTPPLVTPGPQAGPPRPTTAAPRAIARVHPKRSTAGKPAGYDPRLSDSGVRLAPVFPNPARGGAWSPDEPFLRVITALERVLDGFASRPLPMCRWLAGREGPEGRQRTPAKGPGPGPRPDFSSGPHTPASGNGEDLAPLPTFPVYDPIRTPSSHELHSSGAEWQGFELRAELHIYGRAEPGRLVRILGQDLRVGPGGRFFLRRELDISTLPDLALADSPPPGADGPERE
jgi:hypothetical protein